MRRTCRAARRRAWRSSTRSSSTSIASARPIASAGSASYKRPLDRANSLGRMPAAGHVDSGFEPLARAFSRLVGRRDGGGALAVQLNGGTVVDIYTGYADRARTRPWTPDTLAISF